MQNRTTEISRLAGKSHRPIDLPIRTPSTREREGFTNLFLHVATCKLVQCMITTFRHSRHDARPRCPPQTPLSTVRVPDLQATPRCLALDLGQFREFPKENYPILVAAPTAVRLLLQHCIRECSTRQLALSRDVSSLYRPSRDRPNNVHKYLVDF